MNNGKKIKKNSSGNAQSIVKNEKKAQELIKEKKIAAAKKLLQDNLETGTGSTLTYDLLLYIYGRKNDYRGVIKVLNAGIKYSDNKQKYRKLKKNIIAKKIIDDIERIIDTETQQ